MREQCKLNTSAQISQLQRDFSVYGIVASLVEHNHISDETVTNVDGNTLNFVTSVRPLLWSKENTLQCPSLPAVKTLPLREVTQVTSLGPWIPRRDWNGSKHYGCRGMGSIQSVTYDYS